MTPYNVRIKPELYQELKVLADKSDRSITNYINKILADWVKLQGQVDKLDGPEADEYLTKYIYGDHK